MEAMEADYRDKEVLDLLEDIVGFELAGVVRFTHYALMVSGPNRIPIVEFLKQNATDSLQHAQRRAAFARHGG